MEKHPKEGQVQTSHIDYDERLLQETKSSTADARDMARMGKPQEMKVHMALSCFKDHLEADDYVQSATSVRSPCSASA
jgi:hypothetical protein